ncbi:MAG: SUMF1/EgtB/PvdO family nonheme iron enzyme [Anaerolineaceae bacterium]|nr:SUMF1/EgtB/PvdO family nonheme iron enzyme [Anaerolineaceae bacterium]
MVYKAYDLRLDRFVALKALLPEKQEISDFLSLFDREAKALAKLLHPNIVNIIDYGQHEKIPYLVMPYLPGGTLKDRLDSPMPWREAVSLIIPIAEALDYVHRNHVIHRDVKPANILLTSTDHDGKPMLSDFGISKLLYKNGQTAVTSSGIGIGTPDYMAPEQWMGTAVKQTDIYALGVVLYQMVSGKLPYQDETPGKMFLQHFQAEVPSIREIIADTPGEVDEIIQKALQKDPEDRFDSALDFAEQLHDLLDGRVDKRSYAVGLRIDSAQQAEPNGAHPFVNPWEEGHIHWGDDGNLWVDNDQLDWISEAAEKKASSVSVDGTQLGRGAAAQTKKNWWMSLFDGVTFHWRLTASFLAAVILTVICLVLLRDTSVVSGLFTGGAHTAQVFAGNPTESYLRMTSDQDGMELIYIPAGTFLMGASEQESRAIDAEQPAHQVSVHSFMIDQTEITNGMYAKCVEAGACTAPSLTSSATHPLYYGNPLYENHPVINVNYLQASAYCEWAGRRLPTEAEWEYAARAEAEGTYPWGDYPPDESRLNFGDHIGDTVEVGLYETGATLNEVYDLAGNVWEWVADWYAPYYDTGQVVENWIGPDHGDRRVIRGGSWNSDRMFVRSTVRFAYDPQYADIYTGFRCAQTP